MFKRKRLETDWNWSHALRNSLWETLASKYPREFLPLGTVSAEVGSTMRHIGQLGMFSNRPDTIYDY